MEQEETFVERYKPYFVGAAVVASPVLLLILFIGGPGAVISVIVAFAVMGGVLALLAFGATMLLGSAIVVAEPVVRRASDAAQDAAGRSAIRTVATAKDLAIQTRAWRAISHLEHDLASGSMGAAEFRTRAEAVLVKTGLDRQEAHELMDIRLQQWRDQGWRLF